MIKESQQILEKIFSSKHIIENPSYNSKTGIWHVKFVNDQELRVKDLLEVQEKIEELRKFEK